jgi:hypothetical protein
MDSDASTMDIEELTDEVQRPDGVILMNPGRQNRDQHAFRIEQDFQLASQQFEIMIEAQKMIQDTAGVYNALMGQNDGDQSGVAIASLVEQGSTTLAELNDNYRFGRRMVGEQLMALIVQDMGRDQHEVATKAGKADKTKVISLNQRTPENTVNNDVQRAKMQVVLDDIQATAGYRAQVSNRLFELAATLPDDIKVAVMDIVVESTDLPDRDELVKRIRKVTGVGVDPEEMTPEEQEEMKRKQQVQAEQENLALEELREKVNKLRAEAAKSKSMADNTDAKTDSQRYADRKTDAETDKIIIEMRKLMQEMSAVKEQMNQQIADGKASIKAYESVMPDVMRMKALARPGAKQPNKAPGAQQQQAGPPG